MMRQWLPTRVTPPPPTVPREMVTHSRITVSSPISARVGSFLYLRSCGATPTLAKGNILPRAPTVRCPSRMTCETSSQSSPSTTLGPIVEYGPTLHDSGTTALDATIAVGWMLTPGLPPPTPPTRRAIPEQPPEREELLRVYAARPR